MNKSPLGASVLLLTLTSGLAALSWEILWQIKSTLALGVSAWGTAVTLSVTMGGMSLGALAAGAVLRNYKIRHPLRLYALFECLIGICGLLLAPALRVVENLDTLAYAQTQAGHPFLHIFGIAAVIGPPAICMGMTLPVIGLISRHFRTSIALLYGLNTLGAAAGTLIAAFALIPLFGIMKVTWIIAGLNIAVSVAALLLDRAYKAEREEAGEERKGGGEFDMGAAMFIVCVTGFATFSLEISWFRSLTAAFMSTTDAFAIMLSCVLVSLGVSAGFVPYLKRKGFSLGSLLAWAGIAILLATPVIERFDLVSHTVAQYPMIIFVQWFFMTLYVIAAPVILLGTALPWILDDQSSPHKWGFLYGLNALFAIAGSLGAAWILLPSIGFARTAWLTGALVVIAGLFIAPKEKRLSFAGLGLVALALAFTFESGVGRVRVQGTTNIYNKLKAPKILEAHEGPDVTASAVQYADGERALFIDGFSTAAQGARAGASHYMPWMGHLPMLLHPNPKNALVICFGTGQTVNAVRRENPQSIDMVDINANVIRLAHNFTDNENVLQDPRVRVTIMDGRAFMRRTDKKFDVITLEPMPPNFAGVNALYSQEFYQLARKRLGPHGVIAQWLPFHLVNPYYSAAIAKTFQSVFPNAILWIDPPSTTGILLGSVDDASDLGAEWPGIARTQLERDMSEADIRKAVLLNKEALRRYGNFGRIITDDNQLLAYGAAAHLLRAPQARNKENRNLMDKALKETSAK